MKKYEVMAMVWDSKQNKRVKVVIGVFDKFTNAWIFAKAYRAEYSTNTEIIEHE